MRSIPVLFVCAGFVSSCFAQAPAPPKRATPEFAHFDSQIRSWIVESGGKTVRQSLNWYDRKANVWRQAYVGTGGTVDYHGTRSDDTMRFAGKQPGVGAVRLSFTPMPGGGAVRQHCTTPESRQFDFWAGEWDVFGPKGRDKTEARPRRPELQLL